MKPICVACNRFYRVKKTGYSFIEGMPTETPAAAGTREPEKWKPYKLWSGDLWECPDCGTEIISGVGRSPIAEHYQPGFEEKVVSFGPKLQVNDC